MSFKIEEEGNVFIYDTDGTELVMWTSDEYEDPTAAIAALNAIRLVDLGQIEYLKYILNR
jgi:hypothetical protein